MNDEQEVREPTGRDEATSTQAGPPQEQRAEPDAQSNARPNLDAREARISETRKPAGPPLGESDDPDEPLEGEGGDADRSAEQPSDVDPVDPAPASEGGA